MLIVRLYNVGTHLFKHTMFRNAITNEPSRIYTCFTDRHVNCLGKWRISIQSVQIGYNF